MLVKGGRGRGREGRLTERRDSNLGRMASRGLRPRLPGLRRLFLS